MEPGRQFDWLNPHPALGDHAAHTRRLIDDQHPAKLRQAREDALTTVSPRNRTPLEAVNAVWPMIKTTGDIVRDTAHMKADLSAQQAHLAMGEHGLSLHEGLSLMDMDREQILREHQGARIVPRGRWETDEGYESSKNKGKTFRGDDF